MTPEPMSAREAWEIVKAGEPTVVVHFMRDGIYESTEAAYEAKRAKYARAAAIVDALVDAHEAVCAHADNDCLSDDFMLSVEMMNARDRLRALERGEDAR